MCADFMISPLKYRQKRIFFFDKTKGKTLATPTELYRPTLRHRPGPQALYHAKLIQIIHA